MSKWNDIKIGDFFVPINEINGQTYLYQKIDYVKCGYNAVLLNTGEVCNIYINYDTSTQFKKVEVEFAINYLE